MEFTNLVVLRCGSDVFNDGELHGASPTLWPRRIPERSAEALPLRQQIVGGYAGARETRHGAVNQTRQHQCRRLIAFRHPKKPISCVTAQCEVQRDDLPLVQFVLPPFETNIRSPLCICSSMPSSSRAVFRRSAARRSSWLAASGPLKVCQRRS